MKNTRVEMNINEMEQVNGGFSFSDLSFSDLLFKKDQTVAIKPAIVDSRVDTTVTPLGRASRFNSINKIDDIDETPIKTSKMTMC